MTAPLLDIASLSVAFGGVAVLQAVDLRVQAGSIHGLIGPNGAGKTTLINCISRLVRPNSGTMHFDGIDLTGLSAHQVAGAGIARTFQNFGLIGELSVLDNVVAGRHARHPGTLFDELVCIWRRNANERAARTRALDALEMVGLTALAQHPVSSLSYGTRKSVELARASILDPKLLMLDEPTAGLSRGEMEDLRQTLLALRKRSGVTILVITHHIEFLLGVADQVTVLDLGKCIASGHPSLVRDNPQVVAAYVGTEE
jgi:branched-chain amino acid transport system ATP-binding protein